VVVASKIGAPNDPEYAIGAVAEDGSVWLNDEALDRTGISDDSLATERERERQVVAVPVGPPDTLDTLERYADEIIAVERPRNFRAVGAHYRNFDQVSDEKAMSYLA
jgi:predicted phosphoribosyltransferase